MNKVEAKETRGRTVALWELCKLDPHLASVRDGDDVPPEWRAFWKDLDRRIAEKCKLVR